MNNLQSLIAGLLLSAVSAQVSATPLFDESTVLDIELTGPLGELQSDKFGKQTMPFTLRTGGTEHTIDVRLRGNSRRDVCSFPPMRLSFSKKKSAGTLFENQKHLKLVTHCRDSAKAQQSLLREYMAYRIFNVLSENSYRVRLVRITYRDTDPQLGEKELQRYGYIIESDKELARRTGATRVYPTGISRESLDARQAALVYVFHYLIGNTDWSLVKPDTDEHCCHNGALFDFDSTLSLVPYDFDMSGLVSARYAKPDPSLNISSVRHRKYRGYCLPPGELSGALQTIMDKQVDIAAMPFNTPGVDEKVMKNASKYLEAFFKSVKNIEKTASKFEARCL
jgi:hypothetical protein